MLHNACVAMHTDDKVDVERHSDENSQNERERLCVPKVQKRTGPDEPDEEDKHNQDQKKQWRYLKEEIAKS